MMFLSKVCGVSALQAGQSLDLMHGGMSSKLANATDILRIKWKELTHDG